MLQKILQSYLPRIQANAYQIKKALEQGAENEYEKVIINKLANIGYLASQAICDLTGNCLIKEIKTIILGGMDGWFCHQVEGGSRKYYKKIGLKKPVGKG